MALVDYEFAEFDKARIAATNKAWMGAVKKSSDFDEAMWSRRLERLTKFCDYGSGSEFCYGIFSVGTKVALGIADISYTQKSSKWIKMLNLHLSPDLDLSVDQNKPDFQELAYVFSSCILGTVKLTGTHRSRVVKLYARSSMLLSFFKYMAESMSHDKNLSGLSVSIEGRWLVMTI